MLDFDASNFRDWMSGVGLLRIVSDASDGRMRWKLMGGYYRLTIGDGPEDLAERCADWIARHNGAWHFGGLDNVNSDCTPEFWREHGARASGLEAALWCAIGSDAMLHRDGRKIQSSPLEYAHGGGHQHWLASLRSFMTSGELTSAAFERILRGTREDRGDVICRWDAAQERDHAYMDGNPASGTRKPRQDVALNALAAIGLASCPAMPTRRGLATPLVHAGGVLRWPLWTDAIRLADLELALLAGWTWPTMEGRKWNSGKLYCFSKGALREPQAFRAS